MADTTITTQQFPTVTSAESTDTFLMNIDEKSRKITAADLTASDIITVTITQAEVNNLFV